ncbi:MAG: outer membrane beta-barrel protein [Planctomycetota bacterium]|jgi:hypothetical protein
MKSRFAAFAVLLFCGTSFASADEFLLSGFGDSVLESPFDRIEMQNETHLWSGTSCLNASYLDLTSAQVLSAGPAGNSTKKTTASSGRISGTRKYLELTPMWGYTFGGRFEDKESDEKIKISDASSFGFRLGYDYGYNSQLEFLYSRQDTKLTNGDLFPRDTLFDLDISYFHIGGSLFWNRRSSVQPYFTGTLGLTHMDPEESGVDSLTRFSMGFGGGVRYFPLQRIGLYTGLRGLVTFMESDSEFRSRSGDTVIIIDGDAVWQFQVYAGLIFVF